MTSNVDYLPRYGIGSWPPPALPSAPAGRGPGRAAASGAGCRSPLPASWRGGPAGQGRRGNARLTRNPLLWERPCCPSGLESGRRRSGWPGCSSFRPSLPGDPSVIPTQRERLPTCTHITPTGTPTAPQCVSSGLGKGHTGPHASCRAGLLQSPGVSAGARPLARAQTGTRWGHRPCGSRATPLAPRPGPGRPQVHPQGAPCPH